MLKIFKASVSKTGAWSDIVELPFNSDRFNTAHPALSDDGKSLFFASDRPGGYGASDLYVVAVLPNGKYGKVRNLGANINSRKRDNFPEVNNGLLYFSSDRAGGLGGLDVYMVPTADLFMDPTNLGRPLNSKYDDFSFIINGKTRKGFFTSDRPQGKGGADIYSFVQEDAIKSCSQTIEGIVLDSDTNQIVKDAIVNILDEKGQWLNRFSTNGDGKFKIKLNKCEKNYKLEASKKFYSKDNFDVIYSPDKKLHKVTMHIKADDPVTIANSTAPKELDIPDGDLFKHIKNIDFLLNKYHILKTSAEELNKVVKIMEDNPTIIVEFSAHTDSRGPDEFNLELTKQRAAEVVRYLTRKGIDHNRIYGKGYGELFPLNHCTNGVECSDREHLVNRRTEFVILAR
jgi:outer membrane protein OmpA-like peptidoglycan-associated protein